MFFEKNNVSYIILMYRVEENNEYGEIELLDDGMEIAGAEEMYHEGQDREVDDNEFSSNSTVSNNSNLEGVQGNYFCI